MVSDARMPRMPIRPGASVCSVMLIWSLFGRVTQTLAEAFRAQNAFRKTNPSQCQIVQNQFKTSLTPLALDSQSEILQFPQRTTSDLHVQSLFGQSEQLIRQAKLS